MDAALLEELHQSGFLVQDLLAVARGLKPMCRAGLTRDDAGTLAMLREFARRSSLKVAVYRSGYERSAGPMFMLARDPRRLAQYRAAVAAKSGARGEAATQAATRRIGELLGYPRCCVAAFARSEKAPSGGASEAPTPFPRLVAERSRSGPIPFEMNFVYNLHSRSSGSQDELRRLLAGGYRAMEAYLLAWIPCAWQCRASRAYGKALHRELSAAAPGLAASLRDLLSSPVVWVSDCSFVPLAGARRQGTVLAYEAPLDLKTAAPAGLLSLLRKGDRVAGRAGSLEVLKASRRLARLPASALLLEFSAAG